MSFIKSILLGSDGTYNIFGMNVNFENKAPQSLQFVSLEGAGLLSKLANVSLKSTFFPIATLGYVHVFVHEMSHALTNKLITNQNSKIYIYKQNCEGSFQGDLSANWPNWKNTAISLGGPLGDVVFSCCQMVAAVALKNYIS